MQKARIGAILILLFNLLTATQSVYLGSVLQNIHPLLMLVSSFAIVVAFFNLLEARTPLAHFKSWKGAVLTIAGLNLTTAAGWVTFSYAVRVLEPAVETAVVTAVGPIVTLLFTVWLQPGARFRRWDVAAAVGLGGVVALLGLSSGLGCTGVGRLPLPALAFALGMALLCGIATAGNTLLIKRLTRQGWPVLRIMAVRYWVLLAVTALFVPANAWAQLQGGTAWASVAANAVLGVIVPYYVLTHGIRKSEPMVVALLLATLPAFILLMQLFDQRLTFSWPSALGVALTTVFCGLGVVARFGMAAKPKVVAIVDAYSSGAHLAPAFQARGYECVHVQSAEYVPELILHSYMPASFRENILHEGNLECTAERLRRHQVQAIAAGCELGVELADQLSTILGLPSNGHNPARRDKYLMSEAVREAGLPAVAQKVCGNLDSARRWADQQGYPVVCKPLASGGGDGVVIVEDDEELETAVAAIVGQRNKLGLLNHGVLVQEKLAGTEYVVDMVSAPDGRRVTSVWRYAKSGAVYHTVELLPRRGKIQDQLVGYMDDVLDALGVKYGPTHAEVFWSPAGPVLCEVGCRPHGGLGALNGAECTNVSQIELTADVYTGRTAGLAVGEDYALSNNATEVFLICPETGLLRGMPGLDEIKKLPSFHKLDLHAKGGDMVAQTVDLFTCFGSVVLIHTDRAVIENDVRRIRELERDGLYDLASCPKTPSLVSC